MRRIAGETPNLFASLILAKPLLMCLHYILIYVVLFFVPVNQTLQSSQRNLKILPETVDRGTFLLLGVMELAV